MRARAVNTSLDTDALQADVMRFMAIIAFCLIAILALVRNSEAPVGDAPLPVLPAPVAPLPEAAKTPMAPPPVTLPATSIATAAEPEPAGVSNAPVTTIQPAVAKTPGAEAAPTPEPMLDPVPTQQAPVGPRPLALPTPMAVAAEPVVAQREVESVPATADEAGLSLRFATEQDFLRLIARGEVLVYLFKPGEVRKLGSDYRFQPAAAPGELFEMLPATIPELVRSSAAQAVDAMADYRFGVKFPARIERRIASLVDSVAAGELLIDRFGQVTHVAERS